MVEIIPFALAAIVAAPLIIFEFFAARSISKIEDEEEREKAEKADKKAGLIGYGAAAIIALLLS